ncbi:MAG: hypothetical protein AAGI66_06290 [Cyanobacteria bacterium P01_H01_bin.74]
MTLHNAVSTLSYYINEHILMNAIEVAQMIDDIEERCEENILPVWAVPELRVKLQNIQDEMSSLSVDLEQLKTELTQIQTKMDRAVQVTEQDNISWLSELLGD